MLTCSSSSSSTQSGTVLPFTACVVHWAVHWVDVCILAAHVAGAAGFCKVTVCARLFALSLATVLACQPPLRAAGYAVLHEVCPVAAAATTTGAWCSCACCSCSQRITPASRSVPVYASCGRTQP